MKYLLLLIGVSGLFFACVSTPEVKDEVVVAEPTVVVKEQPAIVSEPEVIIVPEPEQEYKRSIGELTETEVSFDAFQKDKTEILDIIKKLDRIMKTRDYLSWRKYVSPESLRYWSNKLNLKIIESKLPDKNITLKTVGDYFGSVFIPSRINREVTEIRYNSLTSVKAVEVDGDKDIIYYEFEKIGEKWLIKLPTL